MNISSRLDSAEVGEETLEDILNGVRRASLKGGRDDTETWKVPSLFFVHNEASSAFLIVCRNLRNVDAHLTIR